jgi:hypothetical protein
VGHNASKAIRAQIFTTIDWVPQWEDGAQRHGSEELSGT